MIQNLTIHKTFNIYCDESCHIEHDHKAFMFLGSVSSAYNQVKLHTAQINELKQKTQSILACVLRFPSLK
jgi:hypothetical protein